MHSPMKRGVRYFVYLTLFVLGTCSTGKAGNIDLVALPDRDTVELTIYNSEDLTLVRELRYLTIKKGHNRLQFSWAGTLIDPTSVELRPLRHQDAVEIIDTIFPQSKPQSLFWNVQSEVETQIPFEVLYFTSGLTWQMDYVATTNPEETQVDLEGFVRVHNRSGEDYGNARVRLIVGKINLVDKIAALASVDDNERDEEQTVRSLNEVEKRLFFKDALLGAEGGFGGGGAIARGKDVQKESVGEYFMFSIEGTETVPNGWSKRMSAVKAEAIDIEEVYRLRAHQYGPRPVRFFIFKNVEENSLGESPLPNGVIRVFRRNGKDGLRFGCQQSIKYVPIGADVELNLGTDDLVVHESLRSETRRSDFQFNTKRHVSGWDEHRSVAEICRNFHSRPITFEIHLRMGGDVEVQSESEVSSFDFQTLARSFTIPAAGNRRFEFDATVHQGANAKQARLRIK